MTITNKSILMVATLAIAGATAAYAQMRPGLNVTSATVEGNKVSGITASLDKPGFVVLHNNDEGAPPASLGHVAIGDGESANLTIMTAEPIDMSKEPTLMLHYDTNNNGVYDFGPGMTDVDTPVSDATGVINKPIQ